MAEEEIVVWRERVEEEELEEKGCPVEA